MACDPQRLAVLAYADGFTLWHYRSADDRAAIARPGYFDHRHLRRGDLVIIQSGDAPLPLIACIAGLDPVTIALASLAVDSPAAAPEPTATTPQPPARHAAGR